MAEGYAGPFGGRHYANVNQSWFRHMARADSNLDPTSRVIMLVLSEVQTNGHVPLGPAVWQQLLKVPDPAEATFIIRDLISAGLLDPSSDPWCLHPYRLAIQKATRRSRTNCGQDGKPTPNAVGRPPSPRPRAEGYPTLTPLEHPFRVTDIP